MAQKLKRVERNLYLDEDTGIYHVRAMINGKARGPITTGHTTLKMALRKRDDIMSDLRKDAENPKAPTLESWWKDYRSAKRKSDKTWKRETEIMEQHVLPQFGKRTLDDISQNDLERYLNWRRRQKGPSGQPLAEGTITREHSLLHAVFEAAIDSHLLDRNPLRGVEREAYKIRERVLTAEEQSKFEAAVTPLVKRFFQFLLATGIRLEEVRGIRPERDLNHLEFTVTGKGRNGVPKSRRVPIIQSAAKTVLQLLQEQIADNEGDSKHHRSDRRGTLWAQNPDELRQWLYLGADKAGIKRFSPHTLRHTFATRYLKGGGDIYILSQILGHASVRVTEKVYAHLLTEDLAARSAHVNIGV